MKIRHGYKFDLSLVFLMQFLSGIDVQQRERFGSFVRSLVTRHS